MFFYGILFVPSPWSSIHLFYPVLYPLRINWHRPNIACQVHRNQQRQSLRVAIPARQTRMQRCCFRLPEAGPWKIKKNGIRVVHFSCVNRKLFLLPGRAALPVRKHVFPNSYWRFFFILFFRSNNSLLSFAFEVRIRISSFKRSLTEATSQPRTPAAASLYNLHTKSIKWSIRNGLIFYWFVVVIPDIRIGTK